MPRPFPLGDVPDDVVKHLAAELGTPKARVIAATETRLPTGELARLVTAADPDKPNTVAEITVTESGVTRPLAELERMFPGGKLFVPDFPGTPEAPPTHKDPITIDPTTNDWRLNRCERVTEKITVTVPKSSAPPKADVYLLADTTGSMTPVLAAVKAGASAILNNPALAGFDVAWGVGNYRDFPVDGGLHNSYAFAHQVSPTTNHVTVDAAISAWSANEGSDLPEGQLFAMHRLATDAAIGWRTDARRILVWFGDAPGHDPIPTALSGLAAAITEATATADLTGAKITVVAVSTTTGFGAGLDDDPNAFSVDYAPSVPAGAAGQATRITAATGGSLTSGVNPGDIVATLSTLIAAAVTSIGSVSLVPTGATAAFVESITPASYGPLPGDEEHVLTFEVTWVGIKDCRDRDQVFTGTIDVVADGVVVAQKRVRVTVPACKYHYSVEFVAGFAKDGREPGPFLPGRYATAVTIYNPGTCPVEIEKRFAILVIEDKPIGREPEKQPAKRFATITLQAGEATFDDRTALRDIAPPTPGLLFGVLDIVSDRPLSVTATHTVGGKEFATGITSRTIEAHRAP
ncbi:hypothetical protein ACH3VR_01780 [Microbacterium sp. B2969]|uniref:Integrin beta subunit VWA domain-containing protein n=1 Tax=Microbacterium alkaliflavum TaxID=3248839 RepID=A0ABW7Q498_9MICO